MELNATNEDLLWELVLAAETNLQRLGLFLAVCDQDLLRAEVINQLEKELATQGIYCVRVSLDQGEPSLYQAVRQGIDSLDSTKRPLMVSVEGTIGLSTEVIADAEKSPFEKFLGYLQWTREAMRELACPIVIWVNGAVYDEIVRQAPDFFSWRQGVFFFEQQQRVYDLSGAAVVAFASSAQEQTNNETEENWAQSLEELLELVALREANGQYDANLAKLYELVAEQYEKSLATYPNAIATWEKAIALHQKLDLKERQGWNLIGLGGLLYNHGDFRKAKNCCEQALEIAQDIEDKKLQAASLGNLGNTYDSLGEYQQAIALHQQHLEIAREIGHRQGESASLINLGLAYNSLEEYQWAISFHEQALVINREISNRSGGAVSLGNLGLAYHSLREYQRAISFHEQALVIDREIGDRNGLASNTYNIAILWAKLGRKFEAKQNILMAKIMSEEMGLKHKVNDCETLLRQILQIPDAEIVTPLWNPDAPATSSPQKAPAYIPVATEQPVEAPKPLSSAYHIATPKSPCPWWQRLWLKFKRIVRKLFGG